VAQLVPVILVDSSGIFREGLRRVLGMTRFRPVKLVARPDQTPLQTFQSFRPVLALLVNGGDPAVSPALVEHLKQQNPRAHIVVLSDRCTPKDGAGPAARRC